MAGIRPPSSLFDPFPRKRVSDLAMVDCSALPQPDISHEVVYAQHDRLYYRKKYHYYLENFTLLSKNHKILNTSSLTNAHNNDVFFDKVK